MFLSKLGGALQSILRYITNACQVRHHTGYLALIFNGQILDLAELLLLIVVDVAPISFGS